MDTISSRAGQQSWGESVNRRTSSPRRDSVGRPGKRRLVASFVATLLIACALTAGLFWSSYRDARLAAQTAADNLVRMLAAHVEIMLQVMDRHVQSLLEPSRGYAIVSDDSVPLLDYATRSQLQQTASEAATWGSIAVFDAGGILQFAVGGDSIGNVSDQDWFKDLRANSASVVIDVVTTSSSSPASIVLARSIAEGPKRFRGVVAAQWDFGKLDSLIESLNRGALGVVSLRRSDDNRLLARWPFLPSTPVGSTAGPALEAISAGLHSGVGHYLSPHDGVRRAYAFRKVDGYPIHATVGLADNDYLASWKQRAVLAALASVAFMTILVGLMRRQLREEEALAGIAAQLQQSEKLKSAMMDSALDCIVTADHEGRIIEFNPAAERTFGYARAEVIGRDLADTIVPPVHRDRHRRGMARFLATGRSTILNKRVEMTALRMDGTELPIELTITAFELDARPVFTAYLRDISARLEAENAIRKSEERFRLLVEHSPTAIAMFDRDMRYLAASERWMSDYGLGKENIVGRSHYDVFPEMPAHWKAVHRRCLAGAEEKCEEEAFVRGDGRVDWLRWEVRPWHDLRGEIGGIVIFSENINERKQAEQALRDSEERFRSLYDDNPSMYFTLTPAGVVRSVNRHGAEQLGYSTTDLVGRDVRDLVHPEDCALLERGLDAVVVNPSQSHVIELRRLKRDGTAIWTRDTLRGVSDSSNSKVVLSVSEDISPLRYLHAMLERETTTDSVTGLINRREFERRLMSVLEHAKRSRHEHVFCYIDVDQFKIINDVCGHAGGDELLRQLGHLIRSKLREMDTIGRLGGDEFGVLMENCPLSKGWRLAEGLRKEIEGFRFQWGGQFYSTGVSTGLVSINETSSDVAMVLAEADAACYQAKLRGRNRVYVSDSVDAGLAQQREDMKWAVELGRAIDEDRLSLYYQKILGLGPDTGRGYHYEILLRMIDVEGREVSPGLFLPAAERFNYAQRLDRWVVSTMLTWLGSHPEHVEKLSLCSINLSGQSLGSEEFMVFVERTLDDTRLPAERLCFEITETAAIASLEAALQFMRRLKKRGCRFALDDFGAGLSSFGYLKTLPVDYLKIDGSFVRRLADSPPDRAIVHSANEVGHIMGMETIAEFVENDTILAVLRDLGVDYAQGYGVARPEVLVPARTGRPVAK